MSKHITRGLTAVPRFFSTAMQAGCLSVLEMVPQATKGVSSQPVMQGKRGIAQISVEPRTAQSGHLPITQKLTTFSSLVV